MKIRLRRPRRLPSRIKAWFHGTLHPKEIHPPGRALVEPRRQALHRQIQHRPPGFSRIIYLHAPPQPAPQIPLFPRRNIQIDPKSIRRYFKLLVPRAPRIALQKHLANIAVPQLIAPAARIRVRKDADAPVLRHKPQIQMFRSPQQPYLRLTLRIGVQPSPIRAESHGRSAPPRRLGRKSFPIGRVHQARRHDRIVTHRPTLSIASDVATNPRKLFAHAPNSPPPAAREPCASIDFG